jgi:hypothetical protein
MISADATGALASVDNHASNDAQSWSISKIYYYFALEHSDYLSYLALQNVSAVQDIGDTKLLTVHITGVQRHYGKGPRLYCELVREPHM